MGSRRRRRYATAGVMVLALVILTMFSLQRWLIFPRGFVPPAPDAGRSIPDLERLALPTADGPVEGWLLPGRGVGREHPGPAVIFAHGNAERIELWPAMLEPYREMGLSVLLPEYRGYGRSAGSPSQAAITSDFVRFHDLLARRPEVDPRRIVFHGRSLGGGVLCALAAQRPPAALILQSTFTSMTRMARRFLVPGFLVRDPFDNLTVVATLDCPVLVVHGRRDRLIPFTQAEALRAAARRGTLLAYPAADHNDCPPDWPHFFGEVRRFLERAGIVGPPGSADGARSLHTD